MSLHTVRTVAVLLLLCATLAVPFAAAEQTIKLATLIPEGSFWDRALRDMGAAWTQITNGEVRLRIYSGGVAGDILTGLELLQVANGPEEERWRSVTDSFAESMRQAFVPAEFYDLALAARASYRRQQAETNAN